MERCVETVGFEFGEYFIDPGRRLLCGRNDAARLTVSPKVFDTALYFVERPGVLLAKDRLLADLWPDTVVEENNLTHVICELRRVLAEARGENRYIATVPRRGYRFVADVVRVSVAPNVLALPDHTVAVLPFYTGTQCAEDAAIAAGIAESLLHRLAAVPHLKVIAQTSSFGLREQGADARDIGRRLNARYLVEGSVRHADRRVRVMVQLIDANAGTHVWSLMFDRTLEDVLAVEDDVATCAAGKLEASLQPPESPAAD